MSAPNERISVFIAHARADAGFADQIAALLSEAGFAPLGDRSDALNAADAMVLVLSDASARAAECVRAAMEAERLGLCVVTVLPAPLRERPPAALGGTGFIRFYVDPSAPGSGFFDGQKQLIGALHAYAVRGVVERERVSAGHTELNELTRELKKARTEIERIKREERELRRREAQRPPPSDFPPVYYDRPPRQGPRFPWIRGGFLLLVAAWVVSFFVSPAVSDATRAIAANAATYVAELYGVSEPPRERGVAAQDYTPERDAFAGASGANVRDYPLPHADLLLELPARAPLAINGRLMVQGEWWFRIALEGGRVGFVNQRAVAWGTPPAPAATASVNVTAVDPAVAARAGRAGAKIRTGTTRSSSVIVRVESGAALTITGKRRVGQYWWYRVRTADGQEGFAREDVLIGADGARLRV